MEELEGEGREGKKGEGKGWGGAIQCLASGRHRLSCATVKFVNVLSEIVYNKT